MITLKFRICNNFHIFLTHNIRAWNSLWEYDKMAKFNTKLSVAVVLFKLSLLTFITGKKVQVIRFRNDNASLQKTKKRTGVNNLSTTNEISFCFKIMPHFHRTFAIIKTEQLELWVRGSEKRYVWNINYMYHWIQRNHITRWPECFHFANNGSLVNGSPCF